MEGQEPDVRPHVQGARRGDGEQRDAERAGADAERAGASTEYAANAEAGRSGDEGYVKRGEDSCTAANLDPHEPPGQG